MYISCGDDAVAVEAEMGYVPNNPLFGLPLDSPQVNYTLFAPNSYSDLPFRNCTFIKFFDKRYQF